MNDELQFHLGAKVDELVERGWQPDAARREAERQFGDSGKCKLRANS